MPSLTPPLLPQYLSGQKAYLFFCWKERERERSGKTERVSQFLLNKGPTLDPSGLRWGATTKSSAEPPTSEEITVSATIMTLSIIPPPQTLAMSQSASTIPSANHSIRATAGNRWADEGDHPQSP